MSVAASTRRCIVVTGASSGIGKASAEAFARLGWHVIGTGRDADRCAEAEAMLKAIATPDGHVDFLRGDFAEMAQVTRVAEEIAALTDRVHVLVNNAGGIRNQFYRTSEGLEATFAANHLAPFVLTNTLLPLLAKGAETAPAVVSRVIAVSSSGHAACPAMHWDDLMMLDEFAAGPAYCHAKLANLLYTRELDRRHSESGIVAVAMHPGRVGSNFASHGDQAMQDYMASAELVAPAKPAETIVWLASARDVAQLGGRYFHDLEEEQPAPQALNDDDARRLWNESERILTAAGYPQGRG